jgi:hypothetical protein
VRCGIPAGPGLQNAYQRRSSRGEVIAELEAVEQSRVDWLWLFAPPNVTADGEQGFRAICGGIASNAGRYFSPPGWV